MQSTTVEFALIHSPLVGPASWEPVAAELRQRGAVVVVPQLDEAPASARPFWQQQSEAAAQQILEAQLDRVVLVAHSGAGALLPAIRQPLTSPVAAYVFADAVVPQDGRSRLDLFESTAAADEFRAQLKDGRRFPSWTSDDLREVVPDDARRAALLAELHPQPLAYWEEPIPVFAGWPDAPCVYMLFSPFYTHMADRARAAGWPVRQLPGGHFHMLVDPAAVAAALLELAAEWTMDE